MGNELLKFLGMAAGLIYESVSIFSVIGFVRRAQWLRGRASDSRLREPGFEPYAALWAGFSTGYREWWMCVRAAFAH